MQTARLHLSITGKGQTTHYTELLTMSGAKGPSTWSEKLTVEITSDSVEFQSYAVGKIYDPIAKQWNKLASIHYSEMVTKTDLGYRPGALTERDYQDDARELLRLASLTLC